VFVCVRALFARHRVEGSVWECRIVGMSVQFWIQIVWVSCVCSLHSQIGGCQCGRVENFTRNAL